MGNLCSSGTERSEKKEESQLPDKPKDGEDEALLSGGGVEASALGQVGDVTAEQKGRGDIVGGRFDEFLGSGEGAIAEATKSLDDEVDRAVTAERAELEQVVQKEKDRATKGVEDVVTRTSFALSEAASSTKTAAEGIVAEGFEVVEKKALEGYELATNKIDELKHQGNEQQKGVADTVANEKSGLESVAYEVHATAEKSEKSAATAAEDAYTAALSTADAEWEQGKAEAEQLKSEAELGLKTEAGDLAGKLQEFVKEGVSVVSGSDAKEHLKDNVVQQALSKVDDAQLVAREIPEKEIEGAEDIVKSNAEVASAVEEVSRISDTAKDLSEATTTRAEDLQQAINNEKELFEQLKSSRNEEVAFPYSAGQAVDLLVSAAGDTFSSSVDATDSLRSDFLHGQQIPHETTGQELESFENLENEVKEASGENLDAVAEYSSLTDDTQATLGAASECADRHGQDLLGENVVADAGQVSAAQVFAPPLLDEAESNFLDKAKSLLEAHRNSLGAGIEPSQDFDLSAEPEKLDSTEKKDLAEDVDHETTARDFVESIIEKATTLVSESIAPDQHSPGDDSSVESSVDRGEETLAPVRRGVMFVSPQMSEKSSSLSSSLEFSPPPPPDLSPPSDSTNSSISQGDLIERDELLLPPPPPAQGTDYSTIESNNNNVLNNNPEDDDESINRVAMEVTAKAVQDAIKIVTENGTGSVLNNPLSNDMGISSPSSPDNDEEEMTTTDSSQVERGSPVSDLTDTSAHGSISGSLSSYDPGAAFRQDVTDLAMSPVDAPAKSFPESKQLTEVGYSENSEADLMTTEDDGLAFSAETPTPTSTSAFDSYPVPLKVSGEDHQNSSDTSLPPFSSEVPSSLPSFNETISSSYSKPTIIINSPDSAHHTNGSSEEASSPQTEALI